MNNKYSKKYDHRVKYSYIKKCVGKLIKEDQIVTIQRKLKEDVQQGELLDNRTSRSHTKNSLVRNSAYKESEK